MTAPEIVVAVVRALEALKLPYMVVGSFSSNAYGVERSTKDADFVVQLGSVSLGKLLPLLPEGFRLEPQIGFETITSTTRFRMHFEPTEFMIEFFEVSDDPHDQLRFQRRLAVPFAGIMAKLPSPEDVVIWKLRWSRAGRRTKDIEDVMNVLAVQQGKLDMDYIRHWCGQHGTLELLEKTLASIPKLPD